MRSCVQYLGLRNVWLFCIDVGRSLAIKASMNQAKFEALEQYGTSPLFADADRAALDYTSELTKEKKVSAETFARLASHFSEREICEIVWLVASEHLIVFNVVVAALLVAAYKAKCSRGLREPGGQASRRLAGPISSWASCHLGTTTPSGRKF